MSEKVFVVIIVKITFLAFFLKLVDHRSLLCFDTVFPGYKHIQVTPARVRDSQNICGLKLPQSLFLTVLLCDLNKHLATQLVL